MHGQIADMINDVGMIALTLLAYDRYLRISKPVKHWNAKGTGMRPKRCILTACAMVTMTIGSYTSAKVLYHYGVISLSTSALINSIFGGLRVTYIAIYLQR